MSNDLVSRDRDDSYSSISPVQFLHGRLEVLIEKADLLPQSGCAKAFKSLPFGKYHPCVSIPKPRCEVLVGNQSLLVTSSKQRSFKPSWRELFSVDVCHEFSSLTFRISDEQDGCDESLFAALGQVKITGENILQQCQTLSGLQGEFPMYDKKAKYGESGEFAGTWAEKRSKKVTRKKRGSITKEYPVLGWLTFKIRLIPVDKIVEKTFRTYAIKLQEVSNGLIRYTNNKVKKVIENYHPCIVPNTYFRGHAGESVTLYQGSNAPGARGNVLPNVEFDNGSIFKVRSCWNDLMDALQEAEQFICLAGWQMESSVVLSATTQLTIGQLLKDKAENGVLVYVMLSEANENLDPDNAKTVEYFQGSGVHCVTASRESLGLGGILSKKEENVFTNNQRIIVMDTKPSNAARLQVKHRKHRNAKVQAIAAFVGGLDISHRCYDDADKGLFKQSRMYQPCVQDQQALLLGMGPRLPWHDVHARVTGAAAVDLLKNFVERWHMQVGTHRVGKLNKSLYWGVAFLKLLNILKDSPGERALPQWFWSETKDQIVGRTETVLNPFSDSGNSTRNNFGYNRQSIDEEDEEDSEDEEVNALQEDLQELYEEDIDRQRAGSWNIDFSTDPHINARRVVQVVRSADKYSARLEKRITVPFVNFKGNLKFDDSYHKAYVHHIRHAKHFIYLETEFLIGSSHFWSTKQGAGAGNLVPAEIVRKICKKIESPQDEFHVYLVLSLFPCGEPGNKYTQAMLYYQRLTLEMMVSQIQFKLISTESSKSVEDYLSIFCLGNREAGETDKGGLNSSGEDESSVVSCLQTNRRFMVLVHSGLLVVDDQVAVIGSASSSEKSLSGLRNTEIGLSFFEADMTSSNTDTPKGQVYAFRTSLWNEHLGVGFIGLALNDPEIIEKPQSKYCIKYVSGRAWENWEIYISQGPARNLKGHLMKYPYTIESEGLVPVVENFPDFPDAPIPGTKQSLSTGVRNYQVV